MSKGLTWVTQADLRPPPGATPGRIDPAGGHGAGADDTIVHLDRPAAGVGPVHGEVGDPDRPTAPGIAAREAEQVVGGGKVECPL